MGYTYNGVHLQECQTLEFVMETERDPSGTDVLWNKYTVRVRGFISGSQGQFRNDTPTALSELKDYLEQPRKPFKYAVGGVTLVESGQNGEHPIDAHLGPEPLKATVREVTSGTFAVECGVIVRQVSCRNECESRNPVVSLRWKQTESFDQNWNSRLVTEGRLIVRSDLFQSADSFRPLATPPILSDYQRMRSEYTLSEDGTNLMFRFEDVEVDRLPPYPATKAKGFFLVSVTKNTMRMGKAFVELEGPKGTSRRTLMMRALRICYARIAEENPGVPGGLPILDGEFQEDLFEPKVSVSITGLLQPLGGNAGLLGAWMNAPIGTTVQSIYGSLMTGGVPAYVDAGPAAMPSVGKPPPGCESGRRGIAPPDRKRIAALLAAAFRDPCLCAESETSLSTSGRTPTTERELPSISGGPGSSPGTATISIGPLPAPLSSATVGGPSYTYYRANLTTSMDTGTVPMPGTGMPSNNTSPGGGSQSNNVASPSTAAAVSVGGGLMMVEMVWTAMRIGLPPVIPGMVSSDPNLLPVKGALVGQNITTSPDGTAIVYGASGWLRFMVLDPSKFDSAAPIPPFLSAEVASGAPNLTASWVPAILPPAQNAAPPNNPVNPPRGRKQGRPPTPPRPFKTQGMTLPPELQAEVDRLRREGGGAAPRPNP